MMNCSSVDFLAEYILTLMAAPSNKFALILVGGCSRAGKTVLVSQLTKNMVSSGINTTVINLDSWLVSVDNRKQDSTVLDRYEIPSIISSIKKIQQGKTINPPVYDPISRRRTAESGITPLSLNDGILFVEGIVALAVEVLINNAALRIFVDIPDKLRKQRLVAFYSDVKRLSRKEYEEIIEAREQEEVPFIKGTAVNADVIFDWSELE